MASSNWLLVSTGVVSMAVMLKLSLPVILDFLTYEIPLLWSFALSWLQPPYLYLLINCIILSIVASSKLQPRGKDDVSPAKFPGDDDVATPMKSSAPIVEERENVAVDDVVVVTTPVVEEEVVFGYVDDDDEKVTSVKEEESAVEVEASNVSEVSEVEERENGDEDEFVVSRSTWTPAKREKVVEYSPVEKPPVSSRFAHRKTVKATPEGGKTMLGVSRPKRQEALESTWRTITEGRPMPLTRRHLKKSDTFNGVSQSQDVSTPERVMRKSDTFSGNSSSPGSGSSASGGKLKREPSPSQDELNRRVEAFIKKFNDEMRMQRLESLNQYREVVHRGSKAH